MKKNDMKIVAGNIHPLHLNRQKTKLGEEAFRPLHVIICGEGEKVMQSAFELNRAGMFVTLLTPLTRLLPDEEPAAIYQLRKLFEHWGIRFMPDVQIQSVYRSNEGVNLIYANAQSGISYCLQADMLLQL
ncbi:MAG: hypothetical protein IJ417_05985 [Bacteroidaceae bacterium]|nr:hypothetical protein [Bacteroidaceae bacterium]